MAWIKLDDNTYAKEATPDPEKIITELELQQEMINKMQEIARYQNDKLRLEGAIQKLELEITEIKTLIG